VSEGAFRDDAGRVHLTLRRDPTTGRESVALKAPLFEERWRNEAVTAAANAVLTALEHEPTPERAVELARRLMATTSQLVDGLLARAPEGAVACKSGCDHCCHQLVGVSVPEALAIFEHVERTRSAAELEQLRAHVEQLYERSRGLSTAERFSPQHPCAFLAAGRCSIYDVRPLACRSVHSLDAADCERRLREPGARAEFLAQGEGGRCFIEPLHAQRALHAGLQLGLSELYRLDARGLDLLAAMHVLLGGDASAAGAWLSGQQPFQVALREPVEPARTG
jgi:Fe-S-cluster containining protein